MIAKKDWFALGKLGLRPSGWEGYVYCALYLLALIGIVNLPLPPMAGFTLACAVLLLLVIEMSQLLGIILPATTDLRAHWKAATMSFFLVVTFTFTLFLYRLMVLDFFDAGLAALLVATGVVKLLFSRISY
ncbi:MAG: hypothetical protein Q7S65_01375 [Nanoarchaeota archaeon]|nr:hypothetical protein [Nanoarchaeota archaeon]